MSAVLLEQGAQLEAFDLFPEFFESDRIECKKADLSADLPIDDATADLVLCQEGIEHLPDQLQALRELARILKADGRLLLTTPNISHLRARVGNLLVESDHARRLPANELDDIWYASDESSYFGHLYLIGIQRLRVLARIAGLRLKVVHATRISWTSALFGFLYPLVWLYSWRAYRRNFRKNKKAAPELKKEIYGEIFRLNTSPRVLFGKHLFVEFERTEPWDSARNVYKDRGNIY